MRQLLNKDDLEYTVKDPYTILAMQSIQREEANMKENIYFKKNTMDSKTEWLSCLYQLASSKQKLD